MEERPTGATPGVRAPFSGALRAARSVARAPVRPPHPAYGRRPRTLPRDSGKAGPAVDSFSWQSGRVFPPPPIFAPLRRPPPPRRKCRTDWMAHDQERTANEAAPDARLPREAASALTENPGTPRDVS